MRFDAEARSHCKRADIVRTGRARRDKVRETQMRLAFGFAFLLA